MKSVIHKETIKNIKLDDVNTEQIEPIVQKVIDDYIESNGALLPRNERQRIVQEVVDEILGLGPISPLLKDDTVSEIMVNGPNQVYVGAAGTMKVST